MTQPDRARLADALTAIADEAGAAIMALYGRAAVREKQDASPVTEADEAAERLILARLAELAPEIPVIAEESVAAGRLPGSIGTRFWLVDPLDGTKEFISGNGEFTVNVALIEDGRPTLGVVGAPAKEILAWTDGRTAWRRDGGAAVRTIAARPAPDSGLVAAVSRSHRDRATDDYLAGFTIAGEKVGGSSLKFCLIAAGEADIYPRIGRTMEWDTAAGDAVLRAAGGSVRDLEGRPLAYGKPGFENPPFVARGAGA